MTDLPILDGQQLDVDQARALTDQIKVGVEATWELISRAYTERAWVLAGRDANVSSARHDLVGAGVGGGAGG